MGRGEDDIDAWHDADPQRHQPTQEDPSEEPHCPICLTPWPCEVTR